MHTHTVKFEMSDGAYQEALAYSRELGLSIDTMVSNAFAGYMEAVRLGVNDEPFEEWASAIASFEKKLLAGEIEDPGMARSTSSG